MQKIFQTEETTDSQALRKGKRKRTEPMDSENVNSDLDKAQRDPYSGNAFLPGESSSEDEEPLAELSKEELCTKIKSLKQKLTSIRKENSRLRQSLVMLQVLPQAVTQFEELVGMAEALLKGGGTLSTSASTLWRAANNSSPDSFASTCSNSNSSSSSPISLKAEEDHQTDEKQFKIEKWQIARCNKSKPQKFINDLMQVLYTNEYMATHSLTGAKSSTSRDKAVKPAMNQNEVQEIIGCTMNVKEKVAQPFQTLCNLMDCILQAKILERIAYPLSRNHEAIISQHRRRFNQENDRAKAKQLYQEAKFKQNSELSGY